MSRSIRDVDFPKSINHHAVGDQGIVLRHKRAHGVGSRIIEGGLGHRQGENSRDEDEGVREYVH